jgi:hypothetical protein
MIPKIQIKEPCLENWESMKDNSTGKYCDLCCKKVFDFTKLSDSEITGILNKNEKICARIPAEKNTVKPIIVRQETLFSLKTSWQNMVRLIIIIVFLNLTISCSDGNGNTVEKPVVIADTEIYTTTGIVMPPAQFNSDSNGVLKQNGAYVIVDDMPEFKGGSDSLIKFIQNHITYPETEIKEKAKLYVSFIIDENGKLKEPRFEYKSCKNSEPFEKEILTMLRQMPKWKPGKLNGKKVPVKMTLPINFKPE